MREESCAHHQRTGQAPEVINVDSVWLDLMRPLAKKGSPCSPLVRKNSSFSATKYEKVPTSGEHTLPQVSGQRGTYYQVPRQPLMFVRPTLPHGGAGTALRTCPLSRTCSVLAHSIEG